VRSAGDGNEEATGVYYQAKPNTAASICPRWAAAPSSSPSRSSHGRCVAAVPASQSSSSSTSVAA